MTKAKPRYSAVYRFYVCCVAGMKTGYYDIQVCNLATSKGLIEAITDFYCNTKHIRTGRLIIYEMSGCGKGLPQRGERVSKTPILVNKPYPEV